MDEKIVLKRNLDWRMWTEFFYLKTGASGGLLLTR
jgi:hypothetical protein